MTGPIDEIPARLGPGREFDAIRLLLAGWAGLARGIGDDAAVLDLSPGERMVVSVDAAVEEVHFRRSWLTPREIAYRATAAALSDIAAMGARPVGILLALALPPVWERELLELGAGVGEAAELVGAPIVGGNMTRARELSLTTTVLGATPAPLLRSGARPGDLVYVTGRLGGAGAAVRALSEGRPLPEEWRRRFAHPVPRVPEGRWLAEHGATAAVDVSDGLAADLGHLAAASRADVELDVERVPRVDGVGPEEAVRSGEEYELALTAPAALDERAFAERFGVPLTCVGRVREGVGEVVLRRGGARVAPPAGHDHFSQ